MNLPDHINLGFAQQTFDFDRSRFEDLEKLRDIADTWIADHDHAVLDQMVTHLSSQPGKWSTARILELLNTLFKDDEIHFLIDGKKILPENVKTAFSPGKASKSQFLQYRDSFTSLRNCLSDPSQWSRVEVVKPEKVEEADLIRAQELRERIFGVAGERRQNSLCRTLRNGLRTWGRDLDTFGMISEKGQYPGREEIREDLALTTELLGVYDPCEFVSRVITDEDRLHDARRRFLVLENFFKHQLSVWDALLNTVAECEPNRVELENDPTCKSALEALDGILTGTAPYARIAEIEELVSIVKSPNDVIVRRETASARVRALDEIQTKIDRIFKALDERNANSDTRNRALNPLQTIKRTVSKASSIKDIADCLDAAADVFDDAMDSLSDY